MAKDLKDVKKKKNCTFCNDKIDTLDYKDASKLKRYLSEMANPSRSNSDQGSPFCCLQGESLEFLKTTHFSFFHIMKVAV